MAASETGLGPEQRVVFHTPVATEFVDEKKLTSASDKTLERAARQLNEALGIDGFWKVSKSFPLSLQGYGEPLASSVRSRMPRPLLEATGSKVLESLNPLAAAHATPGPCGFEDTRGTEWHLVDAELSIWSTGAGLITTSYDVERPDHMSWASFGEVAGDLRDDAREDLAPWVKTALSGFEAFARSEQWIHRWARSKSDTTPFWSDPLWTYHTFLVVLFEETRNFSEDTAKALVDDGAAYEPAGFENPPAVRIGLSACSVSLLSKPRLNEKLIGLVNTHTAAWASATKLDSFISDQLLGFRFGVVPSRDLDNRATQLLRLADKVSFFLMTIEGVHLHLTTKDGALWGCLDEQWMFPQYREGLRRKLDTLRALQSEMTAQVSGRRLRYLNYFLVALTIAGLAPHAPTVVEFLQDRHPFTVGISMIALGVVLVILGFFVPRQEET